MNMRGAKTGGAKTLGTQEIGGTHDCTPGGKTMPKYKGTRALEMVAGPPAPENLNYINYIPPRIEKQIAWRGHIFSQFNRANFMFVHTTY